MARFAPIRSGVESLDRAQDAVAKALNPALALLEAITAAPAWTAAPLLNSWIYYGAPFAPAGYYRDGFGIVRLRGMQRDGTHAVAAIVLPPGYRPGRQLIFACIGGDPTAAVRVDVTPAGAVVPAGTSSWFDLANVSFLAEQ